MDLSRLTEKIRQHTPTLQGSRGEYAVLVPLIRREDGFHLLYEVRASSLHHQPNEVCFPGGAMENGETPVRCALRETEEELGLSTADVEVIGPLDFLLRGSSIVYPVLAVVDPGALKRLRCSPQEVADVFTVPLSWLRDHPPEVYRYTFRPRVEDFPYDAVQVPPDYPWAPVTSEVPVYRGLPHPLWGLTARITARLIEMISEKEDG